LSFAQSSIRIISAKFIAYSYILCLKKIFERIFINLDLRGGFGVEIMISLCFLKNE